jgi:Arc/MetJ-type ribon-helix-helix transcriptional regulator
MTINVMASHPRVKVSTTLPAADVAFIDDYTRRNDLLSRAAAYHEAVRALRQRDLEAAYLEADREWYESSEAQAWEVTIADGVEAES